MCLYNALCSNPVATRLPPVPCLLSTTIWTEGLKILQSLWSPISVPQEVQSVHGQWFHWTRAKPAQRPPQKRVKHLWMCYQWWIGWSIITGDTPHSADKWTTGSHAHSGRRLLAFLLHSSCFEVQHPPFEAKGGLNCRGITCKHFFYIDRGVWFMTILLTCKILRTLSVYFCTCAVILCSGQLLPELFCVVWVELIIKGGAKPIGLWLVEDGCQGVRHINNAASLTWDHKQEAVSRLQNEVFQFLWTNGITTSDQRWRIRVCQSLNS